MDAGGRRAAQVANRGFQTSPLHRNKIETNTGGGKGTREKVGAEGEGEIAGRLPLPAGVWLHDLRVCADRNELAGTAQGRSSWELYRGTKAEAGNDRRRPPRSL